MGIYIIKDLYPLNKEFFLEYLGKSGLDIYERIRGIGKPHPLNMSYIIKY